MFRTQSILLLTVLGLTLAGCGGSSSSGSTSGSGTVTAAQVTAIMQAVWMGEYDANTGTSIATTVVADSVGNRWGVQGLWRSTHASNGAENPNKPLAESSSCSDYTANPYTCTWTNAAGTASTLNVDNGTYNSATVVTITDTFTGYAYQGYTISGKLSGTFSCVPTCNSSDVSASAHVTGTINASGNASFTTVWDFIDSQTHSSSTSTLTCDGTITAGGTAFTMASDCQSAR